MPIDTLIYMGAGLIMSFNALTDKAPDALADELVTLLSPRVAALGGP
ncbi:MAG TPA: hypothetical protein VFG79_17180 [Solirubrobacter sp.]|nr:hypothetical protein [Solirubrobacter sp.]